MLGIFIKNAVENYIDDADVVDDDAADVVVVDDDADEDDIITGLR